ncbi:MAG: SRPBCC family protein [Acidimicrobiales bacterium]|jgi:carbon monoxide dehydrogenase subunit G|nr:SRPBCC family protein [Acidimicrobiales bacterium]|tara:strand:- start:325 stop:909 length:585 start_codon:yes stop_codon:yes gene_type:complete
MLIQNEFETAQSVEKVWLFFGDIPQVAACLPGADLTDETGDDRYEGTVTIRLGPVKLEFDGAAEVVERDDPNKTIAVDASGADKRGRGQASLQLKVVLAPAQQGTKVAVSLDLQLAGAAAQYGRGLVADVTSVLLSEFASNMGNRLEAAESGLDPNQVSAVKPASGLLIGIRAARMALTRVFRRFFLPYRPQPS